MKKVIGIILAGTFLFLLQNCSPEEQEVFEENTKIEEGLHRKMVEANPDGLIVAVESCYITYIFNDPNLTPSERAAIRESYDNNHFGIYNYISSGTNQEIWEVDCSDFNSYNELNPGCDNNGCYQDSGCTRASCGSSHPKPKDPEDPFN